MDLHEFSIGHGFTAAIDADDWERSLWVEFTDGYTWTGRPCDVTWGAQTKEHTTYAVASSSRGGKVRQLRLHRLILCARAGDVVDHDDGVGTHCWRTNLRFVTGNQNGHNRVAARDTSSRFKGVSFHKDSGKWSAQIRHQSVKWHLGLFASEVDAAVAYDLKARELFGSTCCLNFPAEAPAL